MEVSFLTLLWVYIIIFGKCVGYGCNNSHFSTRRVKLVHKHELAWDRSFQLAGVRVGRYTCTGMLTLSYLILSSTIISTGHVEDIIQSCETDQYCSLWGGYQEKGHHKEGMLPLINYKYSWNPITWTFKENRKRFKLAGVQVIESKIHVSEKWRVGNWKWFELEGGSSYCGFKLSGFNCT